MSAQTFGKVLKEARLSVGLSQQALARKLGVRASHIGYLEQGRRRPSLILLTALADTLGVDKERLFLLSHPEAKSLIKADNGRRAGTKQPDAWKELLADKASLIRNNVTAKELRVLSHITLLGSVLNPRDYLFILNCIRQAVKQ
ncbi:MAG TPA: helix-turn-helix transcriptional regulator [Candidatus Binataceae bacterium]|jgi:transcriptional regulator with XRE-family HTH domain|nr:helix-turn-helix transcriptional regulator [Candidatus Binataceae bacterium]